ncbi:MAG: hypothetical protein KDA93_16030 [Planctomycetaceae bacterium]|nr:hypothetical protein [Planctomycetaceae bacterium]
MKKTWKFTLAAVAICTSLGGSLIAQTDDGVVVLGPTARRGQSPGNVNTEGAVRLGGSPALTAEAGQGVIPVDGYVESYPSSGEYCPPTIEPSGIDYGTYPAETVVGPSGYGDFGPAGEVGYAVSDDPRDILFSFGYRGGDIYGVNHGFTSLSGFMPYYTESDSALWFFNPRLVITDEGRGAANVGFGHRAYAHDLDRVFSFSTWYDYDTGHEDDYHQIGGSFASIGRNLTFRANANFVVNEKTNIVGSTPIGNARLDTATGMVLQDFNQFTEVAYNQADFEVSTPMPLLGRYGFEWGAGAYWLFGTDAPDATGAKARIEAQLTEDLWVNAIVSNDRAFDTNASVNFEFTIPNAPASRYFKRNKVRDSLLSSDRRYYRVATDIVTRRASMPVMAMMGGGAGGAQALRLAIIDPNVTDDPLLAFGGSGTEDDPFKSLLDFTEESDALKSSYSIIYVRRRDDNTSLNLDTTIALYDNQQLLGEGIVHSLASIGFGDISLPGSTDGLFVPTLTNEQAMGMPVVTLASANQVAGFNIDGTGTGPGIVGTNIDGFSINNVNMTNVTEGIRIISNTAGGVGSDLGIIRDNMIAGIGLGSAKGVSIDHQAGTLALSIRNNTISNFQGEDANQNGILDPSEDTNMNGQLDPGEDLDFDGVLDVAEDLDMDGNLDSGFGIEVVANGSSLILANDAAGDGVLGVADNILTGNGTGISLQALDNSRIMLDFLRNTATGSTDLRDQNGFDAAGFRLLADGGRIDINTFNNNTATGGAGAGGVFQTLNDGTIIVSNSLIDSFEMNEFSGNALDGFFAEANSGVIMFDQIVNSVFDGNGDDGLDLQTTNGGTLTVADTLTGNTYNGNDDNGIELTGGIGGMLVVDIGDPLLGSTSPLTGNGGAGLFIGTVGGTLMTSLRGVTSENNIGSGAIIHADGGTILLDGIAGNAFRLNGRHGLEVIADNGGTIITPFVGSGDILLGASQGIADGQTISNDFSLNQQAGLFIGGQNDVPGSSTALIDLGSVTLNRFQRLGEDIDNDGNTDVAEPDLDTSGGFGGGPGVDGILQSFADTGGIIDVNPANEDLDLDVRRDAAENVNSVIANATLDPSQGIEGIRIDTSDVRTIATLTRNQFIGRRPVVTGVVEATGTIFNDTIFSTVIPALSNGVAQGGGSGPGIGGSVSGTGGLTLKVGTIVPADANTFVDNGEAHIALTFSGSTTNSVEIENGVFNDSFDIRDTGAPGDVNALLGQTPDGRFQGEGIHYVLTDTAQLTGSLNNSTLTGNESDGLLIEINGNNDAGNDPTMIAAALNNFEIDGSVFSNNGVRIDQDGDGIIDPTIASGIKIIRRERGQFNNLQILDSVVNNNTENGITIDVGGANFLNLANMLPDSVIIDGTTITNNNRDGIEFSVRADADLAARLNGNFINNNGFGEVDGSPDVGNGVEVREFVQDAKDSRSFVGLWTDNQFNNNFDDGIDISSIVGNLVTESRLRMTFGEGVFTVAPPNPAGMPILGRVQTYGLVIGDTMLNPIGTLADNGNDIVGNGGDGIDITGGGSLTIANNFITDNGTLDTTNFMMNPLPVPLHAGINIDGTEVNEGINFDFTGRDGRPTPNDDFNPNRDAFRDVLIYSNFISLNNGDGIEFLSEPGLDSADTAGSGGAGGLAIGTRLTIALNEITENASRGIDILQRTGDADNFDRDNEDPDGVPQVLDGSFDSADVSIIANHIKGNFEEGVYIVQTVDSVQNQISLSDRVIGAGGIDLANGESLMATGGIADIDDIVRLRLDIHDNNIIGNGLGVIDFPGTGLVLRVGTSGGTPVFGGYVAPIGDPNEDVLMGFAIPANYFATSGMNPEDVSGDGILDNDLDMDGYLDAAAVTGSGVSASVTGNIFDGNAGDDILFHSFASTVNPSTTGGTWTSPTFDMMGMLTNAGMFTVNNFQADPLARLDLIFSNNRFNSIEANNIEATIGTSPGNNGNPDAGAYYDNAEGTFKSRLFNAMDPGSGPFAFDNRQRNATRFASRYITGDGLEPFPPFTVANENGIFKYPGMGNSTFRVIGGQEIDVNNDGILDPAEDLNGNGVRDVNMYTDQGLGGVTLPQIFIFDQPFLTGDPDLIDSLFEAFGVFPSVGNASIFELPWGWDILEPGTPGLPFSF